MSYKPPYSVEPTREEGYDGCCVDGCGGCPGMEIHLVVEGQPEPDDPIDPGDDFDGAVDHVRVYPFCKAHFLAASSFIEKICRLEMGLYEP